MCIRDSCNTDPFTGKRLVEKYSEHVYVLQNPPSKPLTEMEMDDVYTPVSYTHLDVYKRQLPRLGAQNQKVDFSTEIPAEVLE